MNMDMDKQMDRHLDNISPTNRLRLLVLGTFMGRIMVSMLPLHHNKLMFRTNIHHNIRRSIPIPKIIKSLSNRNIRMFHQYIWCLLLLHRGPKRLWIHVIRENDNRL